MGIAQYTEIDLLANQVKQLEYIASNLESCCNVQMQCRQEVYDETHRQIKVTKLLLIAAQVRDALLHEDSVFYFDLDGIIFNWRKRILEEYPEFKSIDEFNKFEHRDEYIQKAYEKHPNWFRDLEYMNAAAKRIEALEENGARIEFLTATGEWGIPEESAKQKIEALHAYLKHHDIYIHNLDKKVHVVDHSADKAKFATGGRKVLVDDYVKNVNEWRAAGGTAILVDTEGKPEKEAWEIYDFVAHQQVGALERYLSW